MISLVVNGEYLDLNKDTSITLEKIVRNPASLKTEQAEMSFSFNIPSTRKNDRLLGYGSIFEAPNKFVAPQKAILYADDMLTFEGELLISEYDGEEEQYSCNLVVIKINDLDSIFGEETLHDLTWKVDFNGATSVNNANLDSTSKYYFPFISYGAFIKSPYYSDSVGNSYTSKFDWDEYNRAYIETFYPHLNMMETVKRLFEDKGYEVGGTAFSDDVLNNIYMSCNLEDDQFPTYNLGNQLFGDVSITNTWTSSAEDPIPQALKYPIYPIGMTSSRSGINDANTKALAYNFDTINVWNMLSSGQTVTLNHNSYLYSNDERVIVIPKSGFYKINMNVSARLTDSNYMTAAMNALTGYGEGQAAVQTNFTFRKTIQDNCPLEVQLVKNYDSDIELIRGAKSRSYYNGNPNSTAQSVMNCYPHEQQALEIYSQTSKYSGGFIPYYSTYLPKNDDFMAYDQAANPNFICGVSSLEYGTASVIKNGYSWDKSIADKKEAFYTCQPYNIYKVVRGAETIEPSENKHNLNTLTGSTSFCRVAEPLSMTGTVQCTVWLERNDKLELMAVQRAYYDANGNRVPYTTTASTTLQITAISDKSYDALRAKGYAWSTSTYYDTQLNLGEFLSSGTTKKDFVENVIDSFNLQLTQIGKDITIDVNPTKKRDSGLVNLDNRFDYRKAKSTRINFPTNIAVKYKIDEDEWGFEQSVPEEYINDNNWKDYADIGSDVIELDKYSSEGSEEISSDFSYTWYDNFNFYQINSSDEKVSNTPTAITIPVISKSEYMIDGYNYDEAMKHDGYSLPQRLFFRQSVTDKYVYVRSNIKEQVYLSLPTNIYNNIELSYHNIEHSILRKYFTLSVDTSSNYIELKDVEISANEYALLRDGGKIIINDDIYLPTNIKWDCNSRLANIEAMKS